MAPLPSEKRIREIASGLARDGAVKKVILFGSFARGDAHEGSALDLCIVAESDLPWLDRVLDFTLRLQVEDVAVVPYAYTPREFELQQRWSNPFIGRILDEGRVLHEQQ